MANGLKIGWWNVADTQPARRGVRMMFKVVAAVGIFVLGAIVRPAWEARFPEVWKEICYSERVFGESIDVVCTQDMRIVRQADAELFLSRFLGAAGGPEPSSALDMVSDEERQRTGEQDFVREWEPVISTRLIDAKRLGRNRFEVTYANFQALQNDDSDPIYVDRGHMNTVRRVLELQRSGDTAIVIDYKNSASIDHVALEFPRFRISRSDPDGFSIPARDPNAKLDLSYLREGGWLRALCAATSDGQPWVLTYLGWMPSSEWQAATSPFERASTCP